MAIAFPFSLVVFLFGRGEWLLSDPETVVRDYAEHFLPRIFSHVENAVDMPELYDLINSTSWKVFDPSAWTRREEM